MKSIKSIYIYSIVLLMGVTTVAYSKEIAQSFTIQEGEVNITPGFCLPNSCVTTTAALTGTFTAEITGDAITFSNIDVRTNPETGFVLPQAPNDSSGGTVRNAKFSFDGVQLLVSGIVDSRAFDGPLHEYKLTAQVSEEQGFDPNGYYTARQDFRRCVTPLCGGIFVKSVNRKLTRCADGSMQAECYVATVVWKTLGFDPLSTTKSFYPSTPILLKGELLPRIYGGFGNLGEFVATAAYRPATDNPPEGTFAALENNGIVCITTPCFSIDEHVLNTGIMGTISSFDLNPVGASADDLNSAYSLFANNSPLIVVGHNERRQELHGIGITFVANQFYLPIRPPMP